MVRCQHQHSLLRFLPEHNSRGIRQSGEHVVAEIQFLDRERSQHRRQFHDEGEIVERA